MLSYAKYLHIKDLFRTFVSEIFKKTFVIMAQYIDKSALIAEIKRLIDRSWYNEVYDYAFRDGNNAVCVHILNFLEHLEVKEVDLKDERIKDCPYRVVGCEKYSGTVTECDGACAWVTDYLTLKLRNKNRITVVDSDFNKEVWRDGKHTFIAICKCSYCGGEFEGNFVDPVHEHVVCPHCGRNLSWGER